MAITINGTTGLAGVDGSAGTPAVQGADANTGIFFPAADTIAFSEGGAEVARFDSSGNFGIGTTSPSTYSILTAYGSSVSGFAGVTAINGAGSSGFGGIQMGSDGTYVKAAIALKRETANGAGSIVFYNDSNSDAANWASTDEKMRIDINGYVLVGCTGLPSSSVAGASLSPSVTSVNPHFFSAGSATGSVAQISFINGNGTVGQISTSGSATTYATSSDYRLKESIAPMTGALAKVALLKPCTYKWKVDGSNSEGFIAHELQEVVPDCVTGEKDAVETYTDEDGNEQTRPKYQGVDTSFLVATLTAAIQEQQALITQLQADVAALKGTP
jgi:hypothetical protein